MEALYKEIILDNYRDTSNKKEIDGIRQEGINPSCGDEITLFIKIEDEEIKNISFIGVGCSICMASTNMLCNALKNKDIKYGKEVVDKVKRFILSNEDVKFVDEEEDLEALIGVRKLPARIKCALLSWNTLEQVLKNE